MIEIKKGRADKSVIIGAAVVFGIIGIAIFGVYYFAFAMPAQKELKNAKDHAQNMLSKLGGVDTSQAQTKAADYGDQIREAKSKNEITSIVREITTIYERESTREELLNTAKIATNGSFYTLSELYRKLMSEINSKSTLQQLESYKQEGIISSQASSAWKELLTNIIENIPENELVMRRRNTPVYWEYMPKDEALALVQSESWQNLRELTFEKAESYAVPILDTFQRAPTILPGSTVDVAVYDYSTENLTSIGVGTTVLKVIYPKDVLGAISWSLTDGDTSHSYRTELWEAIKAATAGDSEAANVDWSDYAEDLMKSAQDAGVGDYDLQALYVVKVSAQSDAEILTKYEQYMNESKDIILIAHTAG